MAPLVREALRTLELAVGLPKFEPGKSTKRFTLAVSDFTTLMIASCRRHQEASGLYGLEDIAALGVGAAGGRRL
jgi:hypothetical protein